MSRKGWNGTHDNGQREVILPCVSEQAEVTKSLMDEVYGKFEEYARAFPEHFPRGLEDVTERVEYLLTVHRQRRMELAIRGAQPK